MITASGPLLMRAGQTSLLVDARGPGLPVVVHWGADLGELGERELAETCAMTVPAVPTNSIDTPRRVAMLPEPASAYAGRAALAGGRPGAGWPAAFTTRECVHTADGEGGHRLLVTATDAAGGLDLTSELRLLVSGVVAARHIVRNTAGTPYNVVSLPVVLPLPARAAEVLHLTGRHLKERIPQRLPLPYGALVREQRRGRTGHDASLVMTAGTPGFGFRHGEVWGAHVAWSGDTTLFTERLPEGWTGLGGGELLRPGEISLAPGEEYRSPWLYAAYSPSGLDGLSDAWHEMLRARPTHPRRARPVIINTWEAVYYDHNLSRLKALADTAAQVGVERFVLDDGWFGRRRNDHTGLGDWFVADQVWPDGLDPLIEHVTRLGMEFGLWIEPEMVNPDSDLAREHPDWILAPPSRTPPTSRHQQALNLADQRVFAYLLERLDRILTEYPVAYLKWDHNRDLVDTGGVHAQTSAVYALIDEVRRRHPGVEIESCAGGGGRVDLAILERTDRVWTSDCNDPVERQQIQRWTQLLIPPELAGSHVGPPRAHTTSRVTDLSFRAGTALFGHFGIEWDLTTAGPEDVEELAAWIATYKRFRALLHSGRLVRADTGDDAATVHGVVANDGAEALFAVVQTGTATNAVPPPVRLPGLQPQRRYRVRPLEVTAAPATTGSAPPPWWAAGQATATGAVLRDLGLASPVLDPQQLVLLHVQAVRPAAPVPDSRPEAFSRQG